MVGGRSPHDRFGPAEAPVDLFEPHQEAGDRSRADRDELSHLHIPMPQLARHHDGLFPRVGVADPQEIRRQQLPESAMDFAQTCRRDGSSGEPPSIDPRLNGNMRPGLELEIPLARIGAVVVAQRSLDIDRMRVVPLNQVRVVAVHRSNEIGERSDDAWGKAPAQPRGGRREFERQIVQCRPVT